MLVLALLGVSCSSNPVDTAPPTIETARPAASPPASVAPAGTVRPSTGRTIAAVFDAATAALVVLSPDALTLVRADGPPRTIGLSGQFSALTTDNNGTAYVAGLGGYQRVDLNTGTAEQVAVNEAQDTDFTAIAVREDGRIVLGSADGAVYLLSDDGEVAHRVQIFARVDALATVGDTTVVLDRGQTSVTTVDADGQARQALRAGDGATTMATDPAGRLLVADTRGEELLVFGVDPLIMRQRYPVPAAPYGLTGSPDLAWVSETAANVVVGYDLATGIPVEKVRYPTVQQPDFLAFDATAGTLFVVSGSGAGIQVIEAATGAS